MDLPALFFIVKWGGVYDRLRYVVVSYLPSCTQNLDLRCLVQISQQWVTLVYDWQGVLFLLLVCRALIGRCPDMILCSIKHSISISVFSLSFLVSFAKVGFDSSLLCLHLAAFGLSLSNFDNGGVVWFSMNHLCCWMPQTEKGWLTWLSLSNYIIQCNCFVCDCGNRFLFLLGCKT
jgi:hypothetical protein